MNTYGRLNKEEAEQNVKDKKFCCRCHYYMKPMCYQDRSDPTFTARKNSCQEWRNGKMTKARAK